MRFIETEKLNDYIISTENFLGKVSAKDFSEKVRALPVVSLQEFSIEHDREFLSRVDALLNVIVSIIYHPHISNKHEEVILRIELAQQISREDFFDTVRDSQLWKEHDLKMIPEEVHHHQYIDELRIYENRFIGFLVDVIDRELSKFSTFFLSRLPTVNSADENLDRGQIGQAIVEIDRLRRKTQFIKNTRFYKEVSKGKPFSPKIQPTNILLKDRLYRYCYKFYKDFARYEDMNAAKSDLRDYYTILLFKELDRKGFCLESRKNDTFNFTNDDFSLSVEAADDCALEVNVRCNRFEDSAVTHLMNFHVETEKNMSDVKVKRDDRYEGIEILSPWELCYADYGSTFGITTDKNEALVREWLDSKISKTVADKIIYKRYCPVCRTRGVDSSDNVYTCTACGSRYMFDEKDENVTVWFRKIRNRGNV